MIIINSDVYAGIPPCNKMVLLESLWLKSLV